MGTKACPVGTGLIIGRSLQGTATQNAGVSALSEVDDAGRKPVLDTRGLRAGWQT